MVCVVLYVNGIRRDFFVPLSLVASTKRNPARLVAGPCGSGMQLRQVARPDMYFASPMWPQNSGVSSPPEKACE